MHVKRAGRQLDRAAVTRNRFIQPALLVKGAGDIDLPNAPIRLNGGQLLAGNSPGLTRVSNMSLVSTGTTFKGCTVTGGTSVSCPSSGTLGVTTLQADDLQVIAAQ